MGLVYNIQIFSAIQKQRVLQSKKHLFLMFFLFKTLIINILKFIYYELMKA